MVKFSLWLIAMSFVVTTTMGISYYNKMTAKPDQVDAKELDSRAYLAQQISKIHKSAVACEEPITKTSTLHEISYWYCSPLAYLQWQKNFPMPKPFTIPQGMERRSFFWNKIYSHWSKDHYVLHAGHYPEVVFQVIDVKKQRGNTSEVLRGRYAKRLLRSDRRAIRSVLYKMHANRNKSKSGKSDTAMEAHIRKIMAHITDKNKYRLAAKSMRVQRGQKDFVQLGMQTAKPYFASIEEIYLNHGLPRHLARVAFVESSFNIKAYSKVGASGVYQIMPAVGKAYLRVGNHVDERNDPIKAAAASAEIFKTNYRMLGHWPLAVTAYNHGPYGMKKAVKQVGSENLKVIIDSYRSRIFGFASKNFYAEFVGMVTALEEMNFSYPPAVSFRSVKLPRRMLVNDVVRNYGVSKQQVLTLNPDISKARRFRWQKLPRGFKLKLPSKETPLPRIAAILRQEELSKAEAKTPEPAIAKDETSPTSSPLPEATTVIDEMAAP